MEEKNHRNADESEDTPEIQLLLLNCIAAYRTNSYFRKKMKRVVDIFERDGGLQDDPVEVADSAGLPVQWKDQVMKEFIDFKERLINVMKNLYDIEHSEARVNALTMILDLVKERADMVWFKWRNPHEQINVPNLCRLISYLNNKFYFKDAAFEGKAINANSLSFILLGYKSLNPVVIDEKNVVFPEDKYKSGSLKQYMSCQSSKEFEKFCSELPVNK